MTTFKIVFTFDIFLSAETTCTADVLHSYLVFSIYLAKKKQIYICVNHFMHFCQRYNELTYIVVTSIKWNITNNNSLKLLESSACICASWQWISTIYMTIINDFFIQTCFKDQSLYIKNQAVFLSFYHSNMRASANSLWYKMCT
jgi:hypothetical protein